VGKHIPFVRKNGSCGAGVEVGGVGVRSAQKQEMEKVRGTKPYSHAYFQ
jgi:hypothetical protein